MDLEAFQLATVSRPKPINKIGVNVFKNFPLFSFELFINLTSGKIGLGQNKIKVTVAN